METPIDFGLRRCYSTLPIYDLAWLGLNNSGDIARAMRALGLNLYSSYFKGDATRSLYIPLIYPD